MRSAKDNSQRLTHGFHGKDAGSGFVQQKKAEHSAYKMEQRMQTLMTVNPKQAKPEPLSKKEKQALHMQNVGRKKH